MARAIKRKSAARSGRRPVRASARRKPSTKRTTGTIGQAARKRARAVTAAASKVAAKAKKAVARSKRKRAKAKRGPIAKLISSLPLMS